MIKLEKAKRFPAQVLFLTSRPYCRPGSIPVFWRQEPDNKEYRPAVKLHRTPAEAEVSPGNDLRSFHFTAFCLGQGITDALKSAFSFTLYCTSKRTLCDSTT